MKMHDAKIGTVVMWLTPRGYASQDKVGTIVSAPVELSITGGPARAMFVQVCWSGVFGTSSEFKQLKDLFRAQVVNGMFEPIREEP